VRWRAAVGLAAFLIAIPGAAVADKGARAVAAGRPATASVSTVNRQAKATTMRDPIPIIRPGRAIGSPCRSD
jgi:hypothetical protein